MKYITVKLTEEQMRHVLGGLRAANERARKIADTPEAFTGAEVESAKKRFAFRQRLITKLQAELIQ